MKLTFQTVEIVLIKKCEESLGGHKISPNMSVWVIWTNRCEVQVYFLWTFFLFDLRKVHYLWDRGPHHAQILTSLANDLI